MSKDQKNIQNSNNRLKQKYKWLYDEVLEILFRHDLMEINFGFNTDEYSPEVGTILPRFKHCRSEDAVLDIVYEEFNRWFSDDAGEKVLYKETASEIWQKWQIFRTDQGEFSE